MAIGTVVWGAVSANSGGGVALTPGYPSSPAAGDLLLAFAYCRANQSSCFTQPSGWSTLVQTATANGSYAIFYKEAVGDETGTLSISSAAPANGSQLARMCKVPGADTSASLLDGTPTAETEAASTSISNAGITTGTAGSLVVLFTGKGDGGNNTTNDYSAWAGNSLTWSGVANGTTGGTDGAIGIGTAVKSNTGATGALTCTATLAFVGISYAFAVKEKQPVNYTEARTGTVTATGAVSDSHGRTDDLLGLVNVQANLAPLWSNLSFRSGLTSPTFFYRFKGVYLFQTANTGQPLISGRPDLLFNWSTSGGIWGRGAFWGVASNGSVIVATTSYTNGGINSSVDGQSWVRRNATTLDGYTYPVCWSGAYFFAIAGANVLRSVDGITWDSVGDAGVLANQVAATGSTVVVAGTTGGIRYSTDAGATWVTMVSGTSYAGVVYDGAGFLAFVSGGGLVYKSSDGVNWTSHSPSGLPTNTRGLAYGGGRYIFTDIFTGSYFSIDGIAWTALVANQCSLAFCDGYWLAVEGGSGYLGWKVAGLEEAVLAATEARSSTMALASAASSALGATEARSSTVALAGAPDDTAALVENRTATVSAIKEALSSRAALETREGLLGVWGTERPTWSMTYIGAIATRVLEATDGAGRAVISNTYGSALITTPADSSWVSVALGAISHLAYGNGRFIAVKSDGTGILWADATSDLRTWTTVTISGYSSGRAAVWYASGGYWILFGNNGNHRRSTDNGLTWATVHAATGIPTTIYRPHVQVNGATILFAYTDLTDSYGSAVRSVNGSTFTSVGTFGPGGIHYPRYNASLGLWFATGAIANVANSFLVSADDGASWQHRTTPVTSCSVRDFVPMRGGGPMLLFLSNSAYERRVLATSDGLTFQYVDNVTIPFGPSDSFYNAFDTGLQYVFVQSYRTPWCTPVLSLPFDGHSVASAEDLTAYVMAVAEVFDDVLANAVDYEEFLESTVLLLSTSIGSAGFTEALAAILSAVSESSVSAERVEHRTGTVTLTHALSELMAKAWVEVLSGVLTLTPAATGRLDAVEARTATVNLAGVHSVQAALLELRSATVQLLSAVQDSRGFYEHLSSALIGAGIAQVHLFEQAVKNILLTPELVEIYWRAALPTITPRDIIDHLDPTKHLTACWITGSDITTGFEPRDLEAVTITPKER